MEGRKKEKVAVTLGKTVYSLQGGTFVTHTCGWDAFLLVGKTPTEEDAIHRLIGMEMISINHKGSWEM